MLIIQIALGIVLGFLLLRALPMLIRVGGVLVVIAAVAAVAAACYWFFPQLLTAAGVIAGGMLIYAAIRLVVLGVDWVLRRLFPARWPGISAVLAQDRTNTAMHYWLPPVAFMALGLMLLLVDGEVGWGMVGLGALSGVVCAFSYLVDRLTARSKGRSLVVRQRD